MYANSLNKPFAIMLVAKIKMERTKISLKSAKCYSSLIFVVMTMVRAPAMKMTALTVTMALMK